MRASGAQRVKRGRAGSGPARSRQAELARGGGARTCVRLPVASKRLPGSTDLLALRRRTHRGLSRGCCARRARCARDGIAWVWRLQRTYLSSTRRAYDEKSTQLRATQHPRAPRVRAPRSRPHRRARACDARWTVVPVITSVMLACAVLKRAMRAGAAHRERRGVASGHRQLRVQEKSNALERRLAAHVPDCVKWCRSTPRKPVRNLLLPHSYGLIVYSVGRESAENALQHFG